MFFCCWMGLGGRGLPPSTKTRRGLEKSRRRLGGVGAAGSEGRLANTMVGAAVCDRYAVIELEKQVPPSVTVATSGLPDNAG